MPVIVTIKTSDVARHYQQAQTYLKRPSDMLEAIGKTVESRVRLGFRSSSAPDGSAWKRLKNPSNRRGGRSARPLEDSGDLRRSTAYRVSPTARRVRIGFGVKYARYHQFGTSKIPARPMLPTGTLPQSWRRSISDSALASISTFLRP